MKPEVEEKQQNNKFLLGWNLWKKDHDDVGWIFYFHENIKSLTHKNSLCLRNSSAIIQFIPA
jgi:hypothetical protein